MPESEKEVFKDSYEEPAHWRRLLLFAIPVVAIAGSFSYTQTLHEPDKLKAFVILAIVLVPSIAVLDYRLWCGRSRKVDVRLDNTRLRIEKTCMGIFRQFVRADLYGLGDMVAARTVAPGDEVEDEQKGTISVSGPSMVLVFCPQNAQPSYLRLNRAVCKGRREERPQLVAKMEARKRLCTHIENASLASTLERHWTRGGTLRRYRLLIMQSELAIFNGASTPANMLSEMFGFVNEILILVLIGGIGGLAGMLALLISCALVYGALSLVNLHQLIGTEHTILKPEYYPIIYAPFVVATAFGIYHLFRPLSQRLWEDTLRQSTASILRRAEATPEELASVRGLVQDDLDRMKFEAGAANLVTIVAGSSSLLFDTLGLPSVAVKIVVGLATLVFVLIQLYFSAQLRILRLSNTACLLASSDFSRHDDAGVQSNIARPPD